MAEAAERVFQVTGARMGALEGADGLRPALFARVGELTRLRYDYPLVLVDGDEAAAPPLSRLVDDLLREAAPRGIAGERMRRGVLRLEREIRARVDRGARGSLSELWSSVTDDLAAFGGAPLVEDLGRARAALPLDGELVGCGPGTPARLVTHVWRALQRRKSREMRARIDALAVRLADLVRADHLRSREGRGADALRASVGAGHRDRFDFDVMAALLAAPSGPSALSAARRSRIERTLAALRRQRFFDADLPFVFTFERVGEALDAYRSREEAAVELLRAIAVAELEVRGAYVDAKHDAYFRSFDLRAISADDLALFPDYLVRLGQAPGDAAGRAQIIEGLTSGVPLKILYTTDDAFGLGAQLATTAMGLGDAFVLQSSVARLPRARERVRDAIAYRGPALLAVYSPADGAGALPPYLVAAAATESRAFPTFAYDPSAGPDWKTRFALLDDPQPERVWPEHELRYAGERMTRVSERVAFTLADFALCDARHAGDLAALRGDQWGDHLVPFARWLEDGAAGVPFVYAVDAGAALRKVVVDEHLAHLARRCADAWRRLRELDELKRERAMPVAEAATVPAAPAPEAAPVTAPAAEAAPAPAVATDDPYVETPRCTTCNECVNAFPLVFAYNENKQAYIKDVKAASYKDLVEAAEACQVAIIHPGKPRDPSEPGLDELVARAEPFR